jgi:hypothetical protein
VALSDDPAASSLEFLMANIKVYNSLEFRLITLPDWNLEINVRIMEPQRNINVELFKLISV